MRIARKGGGRNATFVLVQRKTWLKAETGIELKSGTANWRLEVADSAAVRAVPGARRHGNGGLHGNRLRSRRCVGVSEKGTGCEHGHGCDAGNRFHFRLPRCVSLEYFGDEPMDGV